MNPIARIRTNNSKGYEDIYPYDGLDLTYPTSKNRRGRVKKGLSHTLTTKGELLVALPEFKTDNDRLKKTAMDAAENGKMAKLDVYNDKIIDDGTVNTLEAGMDRHQNNIMYNNENYRIRKLTPKECMRLMGFDDEDADKLYAIESNSSIYKQAGNSIVVQCLEAIFRQIL